jgi:hypothetical protein
LLTIVYHCSEALPSGARRNELSAAAKFECGHDRPVLSVAW